MIRRLWRSMSVLAAVIAGAAALLLAAAGAFAAVVLHSALYAVPLLVAFMAIGAIAWFTRTKSKPLPDRGHAIDAKAWGRMRRRRKVVR